MTAVRRLDEADLGPAFSDRVQVGGGRCAVLAKISWRSGRVDERPTPRAGGRVEPRRQQRP